MITVPLTPHPSQSSYQIRAKSASPNHSDSVPLGYIMKNTLASLPPSLLDCLLPFSGLTQSLHTCEVYTLTQTLNPSFWDSHISYC